MNFASTLQWPIYLPEDRSLGMEAGDLRKMLEEATAPRGEHRESEILRRLIDALTQAKENDGTTVSLTAFNNTLEFMKSLPTTLPLPVVVVESDVEIGLDWDEDPQRVVSLTIDNSDRIGFAALFGREPLYGTVDYIRGLPETLHFVLARLYPSVRHS